MPRHKPLRTIILLSLGILALSVVARAYIQSSKLLGFWEVPSKGSQTPGVGFSLYGDYGYVILRTVEVAPRTLRSSLLTLSMQYRGDQDLR